MLSSIDSVWWWQDGWWQLLVEWAPGTAVAVLTASFVYWLYQPYEYVKDLTDIGYWHIRGVKPTQRSQAVEVERRRRTRHAGNRLPPPFPNGWYYVIDSPALPVGKVLSVDIIGQNFVVFRTVAGDVAIFDAYCPHLGANLGVGGTVHGDCIECPFHEWRFRASDGACTAIPYSPATEPRSVAKLKKWPASELNGGIFVWYHADADARPWDLHAFAVPQVDSGEWMYNGSSEFVIDGHIQQLPENAADVAHLNAIHRPNMLTGSDIRHTRRPWWSRFATHTWDLHYEPSTEESTKHVANMRLLHSMRLFNCFDILTMRITVQQIGPGYVTLHLQGLFGEFQILQTYVPVEPLVNRVLHRFYFPRGRSIFAKFIIWGESIMFERDMMVWNHLQYTEKPLLMKEEKSIRAFRKWFQQFYSPNSRTFAQLRDETLQW